MFRTCSAEIVYDRLDDVYFSGNTLAGTVDITVYEDIRIQCIVIAINGASNVNWTEKWTVNGETKAVTFASQRSYVADESILWGAREGDQPLLPKGYLKLPFSFTLPRDCASSFEGCKEGYVRYQCTVTFNTPRGTEVVAKKCFSVIGCVDLSRCEMATKGGRKRSSIVVKGGLCGLFGPRGDLSVDVSMPRLAYVCGEVIPINATITNASLKRVDRVRVSLFQQVSFQGQLSSNIQSNNIPMNRQRHLPPLLVAEVIRYEPIAAGTIFEWQNEGILLPTLPPNLGCADIDVAYCLEFEVSIAGHAASCLTQFPLTIGTVPKSFMYFPACTVNGVVGAPIKAEIKNARLSDSTTEISSFNRSADFSPRYALRRPSSMPHLLNVVDHLCADQKRGHKAWKKVELEMLRCQAANLKAQLELLELSLNESRNHSDKLASLCAQYEANHTALHLVIAYSDQMLEATDLLLEIATGKLKILEAQMQANKTQLEAAEFAMERLHSKLQVRNFNVESSSSPNSEADAAFPSGRPNDEERLRTFIEQLTTHREAVKASVTYMQPLCTDAENVQRPDSSRSSSGFASLDSQKLDLENAVILQELTALREDNAELKAQLYLLEKEKVQLSLALKFKETEADAALHASRELSRLKAVNVQTNGTQVQSDAKKIVDLVLVLEQLAINSEVRQEHALDLITDLKRANNALLAAFTRVKKKYQSRVKKLEQHIQQLVQQYELQVSALKEAIFAEQSVHVYVPNTCQKSQHNETQL